MATEDLAELVGQRCWYVSCGGVVAPTFTLVLGGALRRAEPLANPMHPPAFRDHRGSHELLVWCPWRLSIGGSLVARSDEPAGAEAMSALVGKRVLSIDVAPREHDLAIAWSDDFALEVLAAQADPADDRWELWTPRGYLCAGPAGRLIREDE